MTTQQEVIVWHKYLDEKPEVIGFYQIQLGFDRPLNLFAHDTWDGFRFADAHEHANHVFAWAFMPTGWKED